VSVFDSKETPTDDVLRVQHKDHGRAGNKTCNEPGFLLVESFIVMQRQAKTVTAYLKDVPPERKAALKKLRALCRATLTGFEETMEYGEPCYKRDGVVEVGIASQKNFIGLYILRTDVMNAHKHLLKGKGVSAGKGAIRYSQSEKIDFTVIESMLRATLESRGEVC
jgi:uncharacterized protein YdhG (YjbR/CyaY superfamily)